MAREIILTRGKVALVDDVDYESVSKYKWYYHSSGYAGSQIVIDGKKRYIYMHRQILNCTPTQEIDHVNHNGLDNRRCNLRVCSRAENNRNTRKRTVATSQYKGVLWSKRKKEWLAFITLNGKHNSLGFFESEQDAAKTYDRAVRYYFTDFACTNFPGDEAASVEDIRRNSHRRFKQTTSSQHAGIDYQKRNGRWRVRIKGKVVGYFKTEEEALTARNLHT